MDAVVVENAELQRFELPLEGDEKARADYRLDGDRVVLIHTEVPYRYRGRGVGSRLAQGVFDILRRTGRKAVVRCSFLVAWISRHPEYRDVIGG